VITHLGLAAGFSVAVTLFLAIWNALQAALASRGYRDDPSRGIDLFLVSFAAYAPLVFLPLGAFAAVIRSAARKISADPVRLVAAHAGAAAACAATWLAVGLLAPRNPRFFLRNAGSLLDACVAAAAVIACFAAAHRAAVAARRSPAAALRLRLSFGILTALPISLLGWMAARDRLDAPAGSVTGVLAGAVMLAFGLLGGFGLSAGSGRIGTLFSRARRRSGPGGASHGAALLFWAVVLLPLLAALAGALAAAGAQAAAVGAVGADRPNVLLIVADALRADHVGCYGAARVRTPNLDALADRGARVEKAYAAASWTGPATASILTGLSASSHGLLTYRDHLREDAVSLASIFGEAGYDTAGFVANPVLSEKFGFGEGFDLWDEEIAPGRLDHHRGAPIHATLTGLRLWSPAETFPAGEEVVRLAASWLDGRRGAPFFLYLHFMDPHDPYAPPAPYDTMYTAPGAAPLRMRFGTLPAITQGTMGATETDLDRLLAQYDGAITYMDHQIGRLLRALESRGLSDRTLVVFTSDHGEEFNEHGGLGHEHTLYEELVRIPLIVTGRDVASKRVIQGPVRQIDLAPTILEAAGLAFPSPVEGASLWGALSRGEALVPRDVFMEEVYIGIRSPWHAFRSLRRGSLKIIGTSFHAGGQGPWRWELYDLGGDPAERRDVMEESPAEGEALRLRVEAWSRRPRAGGSTATPMDEELERRLRALGYIQ